MVYIFDIALFSAYHLLMVMAALIVVADKFNR